MNREAEAFFEGIGGALGPPVERGFPVRGLNALVGRTAGVWHYGPPAEQREKPLQLVELGVVQAVPRRHAQPKARPCFGAGGEAVDRLDHCRDGVGDQSLLRPAGRDVGPRALKPP